MPTTPPQVSAEGARARVTPGFESRLRTHIEAWRLSVPVGTLMTVNKMLNCDASCGCPPVGQLLACKGPRPGVPLEVVRDLLLPPDDTPCTIPGVRLLTEFGPPFPIERTH